MLSGIQFSMLDEIIVDNFAGGGGASTGMELATGRIVKIAINHDPDAILMHKTNHPHTKHLQASVWDVDPVKECGGQPVGLAWFSLDCKHFSKAKGACGYDLKDNEALLLNVGGTHYFIADIGLRMLTPRELYNAMGFPPDYIIDRDYTGRAYGKSKQVARCGNAVCPPMAEAVVREEAADDGRAGKGGVGVTSWVFLWEGADGEIRWEAVKEEQINGFLQKILMDGAIPATVMMAYNPILFHWVWKKFHKGLSNVFFGKINEEIYGTEPVEEIKHKPVDVPVEKKAPETKFGWIAPDGRYFQCEYGGHSSLARRIVGEIQYISDPEQHLEGLGWAKVFSGTGTGKRYTVDMGFRKKLTDAQLKTIQREGLDNAHGISILL